MGWKLRHFAAATPSRLSGSLQSRPARAAGPLCPTQVAEVHGFTDILQETKNAIFSMASAAALSAGLCTASFAQISGKVTLDGTPPEMPEVKGIASVPQCAALHKDPVYEDR